MKKIRRSIDMELCGLHVREAEVEGGESRTVEGHACVFGVRSLNLVPWDDEIEIFEVMEPGCMDDQLLRSSDVVLTSFHNNENIMGRSYRGKGTLLLSLNARGLLTNCELPRTSVANDILELIRRGDITGMSFAYTADEKNGVTYERVGMSESGKSVWIRHVKRVTGLYDVTIAGHPAYPQTDIANREVGEAILEAIKRPLLDEEQHLRQQENEQRFRYINYNRHYL